MLVLSKGTVLRDGGLKAGIRRPSAISPAAHWVGFARCHPQTGLSPPSSLINKSLNPFTGMVCGLGPMWVRGVLSHTTLAVYGWRILGGKVNLSFQTFMSD